MQRSISTMKSHLDSGTFDYASEQVWHAKMKQTYQDYSDEGVKDRYKAGLSPGLADGWPKKATEVKFARNAPVGGIKSPV